MTEQMEAVLTEILTKALEVAEKTGVFVVDQAPEVIQQLLVWHMVESIIYCLVTFVASIAFILFVRVGVKGDWEEIFPAIGCVVSGIFCFGFAVPGVVEGFLFNWLKIMLTPKLYLLEYAARIAG